MKFFKRLTSFFKRGTDAKVSTPSLCIETEKELDCMIADINVCRTYRDICGSKVLLGEKVVRVKYNEIKRHGYFSVKKNYEVFDYDGKIKNNFVTYENLQKLIVSGNTKISKCKNYLQCNV